MEKRNPVFPRCAFTIAVICMVGIIIWGIELIKEYMEMSAGVHAGHEWLPFYFGVFMLVPGGVVGAISSAFCGFKTTIRWVKIVSFIMLAIFVTTCLPQIILVLRRVIFGLLLKWGLV